MKKLIIGLGLLTLSFPMWAQDRSPADSTIIMAEEETFLELIDESKEAKNDSIQMPHISVIETGPETKTEENEIPLIVDTKEDSQEIEHEQTQFEGSQQKPEIKKSSLPKLQKKPVEIPTASQIVANPESFIKDPANRYYVNYTKDTLNLGSDEELVKLVKTINPQIIKKVEDLDINLSPSQAMRLENWALDNKEALIASMITGKFPEELMKEVEQIVPELKKLPKQDKVAVFKEARKAVNNTIFESMVKAELQLGYLAGDVSKGATAQLNAELLNIRKITIGGITIEDVHAEVQVGYPQNGILLLSGKVKTENSNFSYQGDILGLSYDIRKKALNFNLVDARVNYNIFPWLQAYGGLGIGVRSYTDGTVVSIDPRIGVEAKKKSGKLEVKARTEGKFQVGEQNAVLSCGGSAGLEILNKDTVKIHTGIITELNLSSNPRQHGNSVEWFNGIGISGEF